MSVPWTSACVCLRCLGNHHLHRVIPGRFRVQLAVFLFSKWHPKPQHTPAPSQACVFWCGLCTKLGARNGGPGIGCANSFSIPSPRYYGWTVLHYILYAGERFHSDSHEGLAHPFSQRCVVWLWFFCVAKQTPNKTQTKHHQTLQTDPSVPSCLRCGAPEAALRLLQPGHAGLFLGHSGGRQSLVNRAVSVLLKKRKGLEVIEPQQQLTYWILVCMLLFLPCFCLILSGFRNSKWPNLQLSAGDFQMSCLEFRYVLGWWIWNGWVLDSSPNELNIPTDLPLFCRIPDDSSTTRKPSFSSDS